MKTSLKRCEVDLILKKGKRVSKDEITVIHKNNSGESRVTVIISKKVIRKSADRNKVKRVVRGFFINKKIKGKDFVVIYKKKKYNKKEVADTLEKITNEWYNENQ